MSEIYNGSDNKNRVCVNIYETLREIINNININTTQLLPLEALNVNNLLSLI